MLCYCGALLIVNEAGSLEPAEDITEVKDEGRSIPVSAVFLKVDSEDMIVTDGSGSCYPWSWQPVVFNCTNLALIEVINCLNGIIIPHLCLLHHIFNLIRMNMAQSLM